MRFTVPLPMLPADRYVRLARAVEEGLFVGASLAAVTVAADLCVVAGSAATIAMLKGDDGPRWLAGLGLAHLWIDVDGRAGGDLLRAG